MSKTATGNFFEDFRIGQQIRHATPRTLSDGDVALYTGLYGARFAMQSSRAFAQEAGYRDAPLDDLLVFHMVFGKTVPDISLNAVANLGYAECRFLRPVFAGDTLAARSEVIGLKENSNGQTGTVYVRSQGFNQAGEEVLSYVRWVMVKKHDPASPTPAAQLPALAAAVEPAELGGAVPELRAYDRVLAGSAHLWGDYAPGERIDHVDGMTVEEAEHMLATRLYHNTARVHFNQHAEAQGKFGRRLVYGGHVMSIARALSFNGLGNCFHLAAINGGRHAAPVFAGDTIYAWSEVAERAEIAGRRDIGALRLITRAVKNSPAAAFPAAAGGPGEPGVVLELDYWAVLPR